MDIYNGSGQRILRVVVDDSSYQYKKLAGDHNLILKYALATHIELPVGSYCTFNNETYTLMRPENFKMIHTRNYEYTVTFESVQSKAKIWKFRNPVDGRLKFPLTAKPIEHLRMFVDNMNRHDSGWAVGECIDSAEHLISYDHDYCLNALTKMASEFEVEWEIVGKTVSLCKVEHYKSSPLELCYGYGNGFKSGVGRSNTGDKPPVDYLFVQGGDRNIDRSKYRNGNNEGVLLLPNNQEISYDGEHFEDEDGYNSSNARSYVVDNLGMSICRSDKTFTTSVEDSLDASDIYPKRVGMVKAVIDVDVSNNFYDIVDDVDGTDEYGESFPAIPASLDYNDCQLEGETMTIVFQTGRLAGREFEVNYFHTASGGKRGRRFEIVPQEIDGVMMPNELHKPQAGDKYAVFNVMLPQAYICDNSTKSGAEWDMFRSAVKSLYESEETKYTFTGELDGLWAKQDWTNIGGHIVLGGYIRFYDTNIMQEGILLRIVGVKTFINKPYSPQIEISNEVKAKSFSTDMLKVMSDEVIIEANHKDALQYTKRRFADAKETMAMLENAMLEHFTDSITPIAVQTMAMLVGDESLQFRYIQDVDFDIYDPTPVAHNVTYNSTTKQLYTASGVIQHLTLGIDSISASHTKYEYLYWRLSAYTSAPLTDATKKYYFYIKAEIPTNFDPTAMNINFATYMLSETAKPLVGTGTDAGYYFLLYGILNSEIDGERSFATLYGFTEILPGRITTDRIVSSDGNSYFDMLNNALKLGSVFDFNSNGDGKLVLKGTLVQSLAGNVTAPLGCWRGTYNSANTYYKGDEVTYTDNNSNTSTYRYINDIASNTVPTNTSYWQVIAQGQKGADGTSVTVKGSVYYVAHDYSELSRVIPTQTYVLGIIVSSSSVYRYAPDGYGNVSWQIDPNISPSVGDGVMLESNGHLYIWNGSLWGDNGRLKGDKGDKGDTGDTGNYTEYRYAKNGSTSTPPSLVTTDLVPSGWSSNMPTLGSLEYLWMTYAMKSGDGSQLITNWATPVRISPYDGQNGANGNDGADGDDGRGVASISELYAVSTSGTTAPTSGWGSTLPTLDETNKYLWNQETIAYSDNSTPTVTTRIIGVYGNRGVGISAINEKYLATHISDISQVTKSLSGWTDSVQQITSEKPYLYNYEIITWTDGTTTETDVRLIGHYGSDGADGLSPASVYRGVYSATAIYYGNAHRVDIVKSGNTWYVARVDAPNGDTGFSGKNTSNTDYWNTFGGSFESVATNLLLANLANIGGLIFRNSRIESQKLSDGSTTTGETNKLPMLLINGTNGEAQFAGGKVKFNSDGTVNIGNGKFTIDAQGNVTLNDIIANNGIFNGVINASGGIILNTDIIRQAYTTIESSCVVAILNGDAIDNIYMPDNAHEGQQLTIINWSQKVKTLHTRSPYAFAYKSSSTYFHQTKQIGAYTSMTFVLGESQDWFIISDNQFNYKN